MRDRFVSLFVWVILPGWPLDAGAQALAGLTLFGVLAPRQGMSGNVLPAARPE